MSVAARKITVAEYAAMTERGDFEPVEEHRVELIRGELVPKFGDDPRTPMNPPHANVARILADWSYGSTSRDRVQLRIGSDLNLAELDSQPQPDIAWLVDRDYSEHHPTALDVFLIIEVSDSSIGKDRGVKSELYAEAGVADYWIADIPNRRIEVRRDPVGLEYRSVTVYGPGQEVRPLAFPDIALPVSRIFPGA